MKTLAEYLATEQAREDVRRMLSTLGAARLRNEWYGCAWKTGAWQEVAFKQHYTHDVLARVYYRPEGDRYVVTDLGEGFRAACLRGFDRCQLEHMQHLAKLAQTFPGDLDQEAPLGTIELRNVAAANIPDAICRVMLASLKIAEVLDSDWRYGATA